jgi:hypothetical protein
MSDEIDGNKKARLSRASGDVRLYGGLNPHHPLSLQSNFIHRNSHFSSL